MHRTESSTARLCGFGAGGHSKLQTSIQHCRSKKSVKPELELESILASLSKSGVSQEGPHCGGESLRSAGFAGRALNESYMQNSRQREPRHTTTELVNT